MKNIILIICIFFLYSCGYTSVYKNQKNRNFQIIVTDMKGDTEMNNQIKNQLDLYSNKDASIKYNVSINSVYNKVALIKTSTGAISDFKITVNSTFIIDKNNEIKKMTFYDSISIKNQTDTFEQTIYEKNIRRNFASTIREKLLSKIVTL